ncbi:ABC transporter ATP-binding protein [Mycoplasmopsis synoviae]|uniref:ABC transporter ATP-binding protein n=1 Tax=Mycoplasmopsis synoviae TaxID=2109 RepID=UPI001CE04FB2|nr:ABC transporter ATP-binding protein [Mycoplasmopsis synoviae]UBX97668.1 ABC transporter ATP-binding protein [Mycoplasmopsis synoviae]UBX98353.1 ABC transporter ATP-binding protein [Mycoplasmopsis synoviae]UBX98704.1 ABC transporter ATP-binding protein [Mycoplasmopsis synoviae]UBX99547.1 ABC transporter ATP-binding protein [Mycoplasmopsis synoviae]UBX99890.1 ABC transporter ATP-binding protein [Mycoplasmopsis synoviae]
MDKILTVQNLNKTYSNFWGRRKKQVLKDLSFDLYKSEKLAIVAKNGAGKTTLAKIISGYIGYESGEIKYNYEFTWSPYEEILLEFQESHNIPFHFVGELINDYKVRGKERLISKDYESYLYEKLNIKRFKGRRFSKLSGGEKQILKLYLSLIVKTKILILDEFTSALDFENKKFVREILIEYLENFDVTLILISHDAGEIRRIADRIIVLRDGKVFNELKDIKSKFKNDDEIEEVLKENIEDIAATNLNKSNTFLNFKRKNK